MTTTSRQPKGLRAGGQFAAVERAEPSVSLASITDTRLGAGTQPMGKREMLGPGTLADRSPAWTPAAIKRFLGEPDKLIRNPVYRNGPKMRMFSTDRVDEVEATDEWKAWEEGHHRRSAAHGPRKPEEEKLPPKVEVGHGRNGFYPVVRR
ncbi:hypothetical protein [Arthrobacter sp. UYCo732]|uniref:hypothetical protein n=1 Tax=Arthrobacter sp. UYCo732 TaxID=3156336 RepID=UPI0033924516